MFTVEYFNQVVVITSLKVRRVNFLLIERLRKLIIQAMKQPCRKIVLNLVGVQIIQPGAVETLKMLCGMASSLGIELVMVNINAELHEQIKRVDYKNQLKICRLQEVEEIISLAE
jgi:anti-anti-sigma regulatory factor